MPEALVGNWSNSKFSSNPSFREIDVLVDSDLGGRKGSIQALDNTVVIARPKDRNAAEAIAPELRTNSGTRIPSAFDLTVERRRVLAGGSQSWNYFYNEIVSFLSENYGKVGDYEYEHLIRRDERGRERLWFNSGRPELARNSYESITKDSTLPWWYRQRGHRDLVWVDGTEDLLQQAQVGEVYIDASNAPFDIPVEERGKSGFGKHSFLRVHEVVMVGNERRLRSRALRNYLALEEQQVLVRELTAQFIEGSEILGSVGRLAQPLNTNQLRQRMNELYEATPEERRIEVSEDELRLLRENKMEPILKRKAIQNWIKGIFNMMLNTNIPGKEILAQVQGLEMAIKKLVKGEYVDLNALEDVSPQSFISSDFRRSESVQTLVNVPYKAEGGSCGIGSIFTESFSVGSSAVNLSGSWQTRGSGFLEADSMGSLKFPCPSCGFINKRSWEGFVDMCQNRNCPDPRKLACHIDISKDMRNKELEKAV